MSEFALATAEPQPDDAQRWADAIRSDFTLGVAGFVRAGEKLRRVKAEVGHGGWMRMFAAARDFDLDPVPRPLPFSVATAERLMKIAAHPVLSNSAHWAELPPSWRTLYELTRVPDVLLLAALKDGRIHPGLRRRDVAALGRSLPTAADAVRRIDEAAAVCGLLATEARRVNVSRDERAELLRAIGELARQAERALKALQ